MQPGERFLHLGVRGPEDLLVGDSPKSKFPHCFPTRTEIHDFTDAGYAGGKHFDGAKACGEPYFVTSQLLVFGTREARDPSGEWKIFQETTEDGEFKVGVSVDETRDDGATAEADAMRALSRRFAAALSQGKRAQTQNPPIIHGKPAVADGRTRNGTDPVGLEDGHAEKTWERTVKRSIRSSFT